MMSQGQSIKRAFLNEARNTVCRIGREIDKLGNHILGTNNPTHAAACHRMVFGQEPMTNVRSAISAR